METTTKELIDFFLDKKILLSPDIMAQLELEKADTLYKLINDKIKSQDFLVFNKDINELLSKLNGVAR